MVTDYLRNALLNHALGVQQFTMPAHIWAALYTVSPTASGQLPLILSVTNLNGVEVSASDYSRVQTSWNASAAGIINNALDIRFPVSGVNSSNWGTVVALGFCDAPVTGNLLFFGPLSAAVLMTAGSDFRLAAGQVAISLPS